MRSGRFGTLPLVVGIIAVIAIFLAAALLPGFALVVALMGLMVLALLAIVLFDRGER